MELTFNIFNFIFHRLQRKIPNIKLNDLLDLDYLSDEEIIENEIISMAKRFSLAEKRIIYKIMKAFAQQ